MATQGAANTWASQVNRTQKILLFGVGQWLKWAAIARSMRTLSVSNGLTASVSEDCLTITTPDGLSMNRYWP